MGIYIAISQLVSAGIRATRNDATPDTTSACDIVADAMAELDLEPATFYAVKRVWQDMKRSVKLGIPRT